MIESLRRPWVFAPTRSAPQRRLGGGPVPECIVDCCIERMARYVKLVGVVTAAEFPPFSLFSAFQVFHSWPVLPMAAGAPTLTRVRVRRKTRVARASTGTGT